MRSLAIDFGTKRVGLAVSDAGGSLATPLDVISPANEAVVIGSVVRLVEEEAIERIVVGLPLNMDDTVGPGAKRVIEFAKKLAQSVSIPVVFVDERLSSFDAEQQIIAARRAGAKITRGQKKARLDALAAATFLQAFLDGQVSEIKID